MANEGAQHGTEIGAAIGARSENPNAAVVQSFQTERYPVPADVSKCDYASTESQTVRTYVPGCRAGTVEDEICAPPIRLIANQICGTSDCACLFRAERRRERPLTR